MGRHRVHSLAQRGRVSPPASKEPYDDARMVAVGDVWTDIDRINQSAKERLGFPTQKPESLLDRVIQASSSEGDTVLDHSAGAGPQ